MWVEETKQGRYKFIERYTDPLTGKYKRVSIVLDKNTSQSRKQAQKALLDKIDQAGQEPDKTTLSDLIEKYREEQKKTVKPSTYRRNYFACQTLISILGADTLVSRINAGYIRKALLATGKKHSTLNEHLVRLKALLRWVYRNDDVKDNPYLEKLEPFSDLPHRAKIEDKFLESDEVTALIDSMSVRKWRDLTEFLVLSGLRFGEAAALLWSDLDFKTRVIHVSKNYDSVNDVVTTPKTRTSIRDVYMQDELYTLCKSIVAQAVGASVVSISAGNLLFMGDNGEHISFYTYNKYLRENAEKTIRRRITPHTLRHTHASLMLEQGVDIDTISRRLGHANSKVTREIYLHITEKLKEKEYERIRSVKLI